MIRKLLAGAVAGAVAFSGVAEARGGGGHGHGPRYSHSQAMPHAAPTQYKSYRHEVDKLTNQNFRANKGIIDPGSRRGRGYDLDHKTAVKECFNRGMSAASCAAPSNLQMLNSHTNRSVGCKVPGCRRQ